MLAVSRADFLGGEAARHAAKRGRESDRFIKAHRLGIEFVDGEFDRIEALPQRPAFRLLDEHRSYALPPRVLSHGEIVDLDEALRGQDVFRPTVGDEQVSPIKAYRELELEDLDQDLILAKLGEYCDKVLRPRVDRARMWGLLGELGLVLTDAHGELRPTPEAVLLFGRDVQSLYPQACVEFTQGGKKRKLIKGN